MFRDEFPGATMSTKVKHESHGSTEVMEAQKSWVGGACAFDAMLVSAPASPAETV
jgi:hypothetical protein